MENLFYIKHKPLEIFAFRMIDVYRMIGRLGELMENTHLASCLGGGGEYG